MEENRGYECLGQTGDNIRVNGSSTTVTIPTSGQTVVLYESDPNTGTNRGTPQRGLRYKHVTVTIVADQSSAANGVTLAESHDRGATYDTVTAQSASYTASALAKVEFTPSAPLFRILFQAGATGPTTFRWSVVGDARIP